MSENKFDILGHLEKAETLEKYKKQFGGGKDGMWKAERYLGRVSHMLKNNKKLFDWAGLNIQAAKAFMDKIYAYAPTNPVPGHDIIMSGYKSQSSGMIGFQVQETVKFKVRLASFIPGLTLGNPVIVLDEDDCEIYTDTKKSNNTIIEHRPNFEIDRTATEANLKLVFITYTMNGVGGNIVVGKSEITKAKKNSKATGKDSPWNTHFGEMARKTAMSRLMKFLPIPTDCDYFSHIERVGESVDDGEPPSAPDGSYVDEHGEIIQKPPARAKAAAPAEAEEKGNSDISDADFADPPPATPQARQQSRKAPAQPENTSNTF